MAWGGYSDSIRGERHDAVGGSRRRAGEASRIVKGEVTIAERASVWISLRRNELTKVRFVVKSGSTKMTGS